MNQLILNKIVFNKMSRLAGLIPCAFVLIVSCTTGWNIDNPYEGVDWDKNNQYKGNFHTHTTRSDGRLNPQSVVDLYHELDYDILAITDHDRVTFPWNNFSKMSASDQAHERMVNEAETMPDNFNYEDRNPEDLKIIDIQGCELSRHHHLGSYFTRYEGSIDIDESLETVGDLDGIVILNHPGRYDYPAHWYLQMFEENPHLIGEEVYNRGDRYPNGRMKWDSLLMLSMPTIKVWGFSNDDMHTLDHLGRNWNMLILPELSQQAIKESLKNGHFYFVYAPDGHDGPNPPAIESIAVNNKKGTIDLAATGQDSIRWISNGKVIGKGLQVDLNEIDDLGTYVRAELYGKENTIVGTQPFGIYKD